MGSPYSGLPARQFWKHGVGQADITTIEGIYAKRFPIDGLRIATAGSCFAQHIAVHLRAAGYTVLDKEPAPRALPQAVAQEHGYGLYSARYGNLYTTRRLLQLTQEALGALTPPEDTLVWRLGERYVDALRPQVEPRGLASAREVLLQRQDHLRRFRDLLRETDLFIFTMGLTEAWLHAPTGLVYSLTPGVQGGAYDPAEHAFKNFSFKEVYEDFLAFRALALAQNPAMKFLLTVSPVPLAATAADAHVLAATVRSKSVLRAVAAQLYDELPDVDYFPSYELISTPFLGPSQFAEDRRNVTPDAVASVMSIFLKQHPPLAGARPVRTRRDAVCEEAMLEAFA